LNTIGTVVKELVSILLHSLTVAMWRVKNPSVSVYRTNGNSDQTTIYIHNNSNSFFIKSSTHTRIHTIYTSESCRGDRTYFQVLELNHLLEILAQHRGFQETTKKVVVSVRRQFAESLYNDVPMDRLFVPRLYLLVLSLLTSPWLCCCVVSGGSRRGSVCVCVQKPVIREAEVGGW
jgi:hypothetical protein